MFYNFKSATKMTNRCARLVTTKKNYRVLNSIINNEDLYWQSNYKSVTKESSVILSQLITEEFIS